MKIQNKIILLCISLYQNTTNKNTDGLSFHIMDK